MPSVHEQTIAIDEMMEKHPELRSPLEFHKEIIQAQEKLREDSCKGTTLDWSDRSIVERLIQQAEASRQHITRFIEPNIFETGALLHTCEQVAEIFIRKNINKENLEAFLNEIRNGKLRLSEFVGASLNEDAEYFENCGRRFGMEPAFLLFMSDMLVQPCLEKISEGVGPSFVEAWSEVSCPICGRKPVVAKLKDHKRYLVCPLCGAEYPTKLFLCINCGNVDPYTLKFLAPEEDYPRFRIDFCEKCKHYVKIIDEDKSAHTIPKGLEDMSTLNLDFMAKQTGLIRI